MNTFEIGMQPVCAERSLVLMKPDAYANAVDVVRTIVYAGFDIIQRKSFVLTADELSAFEAISGEYDKHRSATDESSASHSDREQTVMAVCVSKENAIVELQQLFVNKMIHVSQSSATAHCEIKFFFPNLWTNAIAYSAIDQTIADRIHTKVYPILGRALLEVVVKCPAEERAIDNLRTAMILRNPMKPIIVESNNNKEKWDVISSTF